MKAAGSNNRSMIGQKLNKKTKSLSTGTTVPPTGLGVGAIPPLSVGPDLTLKALTRFTLNVLPSVSMDGSFYLAALMILMI